MIQIIKIFKKTSDNLTHNSLISFTSMGTELAENSPGHGHYWFSVIGQSNHCTSYLHPEDG